LFLSAIVILAYGVVPVTLVNVMVRV